MAATVSGTVKTQSPHANSLLRTKVPNIILNYDVNANILG